MGTSELWDYNTGFSPPTRPEKPAVPRVVQLGILLILAAAAMQVLGTIVTLMGQSPTLRDRVDAQIQSQPDMPANMGDILQNTVLAAAVVMTALFVACYVLIACFIRRGMNWARIAGTVLALLSMYVLFRTSLPLDTAILLRVIFGFVGVLLCYLGPSRYFFNDSKSYRAATRNMF